MLQVWKYDVPVGDLITIDMPRGARPLSVQMQGKTPRLWALVDPAMRPEPRVFRFCGTGHPIYSEAANLVFIDTFQMQGGSLVFHLFEVLA